MDRRNFLKILGIAPVVPTVLMAKPADAGQIIKPLQWGKSPGQDILEQIRILNKYMQEAMYYGSATLFVDEKGNISNVELKEIKDG